MQNLETISMPREEAREKWKEHIIAIKQNQTQQLRQLKEAYYLLSKGKRILDLFTTLKQVGLNEKSEPRLAICQAHAVSCYFRKLSDSLSGIYSINRGISSWQTKSADINLPSGIYPTWEKNEQGGIKNELLKCPVPLIPVNKQPASPLENFYLLWEVESWMPVPPKDPMLLRRLTKNLFAIIATWNLTKLERAIIRGHL